MAENIGGDIANYFAEEKRQRAVKPTKPNVPALPENASVAQRAQHSETLKKETERYHNEILNTSAGNLDAQDCAELARITRAGIAAFRAGELE